MPCYLGCYVKQFPAIVLHYNAPLRKAGPILKCILSQQKNKIPDEIVVGLILVLLKTVVIRRKIAGFTCLKLKLVSE
jgi:hypothetical protein